MTPRPATEHMTHQRGGFLLGLIIGLLVGLAIALGVALYVNKMQLPFVNKLPQRTAEQETAEAQRNQNWNPNAPLAGRPVNVPKPPELPTPVASSAVPPPPGVILPPPEPLAPPPPVALPSNYFVQAGAFGRLEEADQQRARLAMMDLQARVLEADQSGRTIYRVRLGPMDKKSAESTKTRLELEGIDASLIKQN